MTAGKIHAAIIAVMREVGPIAKDQRNEQQKFNYRGVDQVYNAIHPIFSKHGVFVTSEVLDAKHIEGKTDGGKPYLHAILRIKFTYWAEDGSSVSSEVVGEGRDFGGDKASNKAMSIADKYALLQLMKIPVAMVDPDSEEGERPKPKSKPIPAVAPRQQRITEEDLSNLKRAWIAWQETNGRDGKSGEQFKAWAQVTTGRQFNYLDHAQWTPNELSKAMETVGGAR